MQGLEALVNSYQETGDDRFFGIIFTQYRSYIQGRAYKAANRYGLDECDCESVLAYSLMKATLDFDFGRETLVPFAAFVNLRFNQALTQFYDDTHSKLSSKIELVYCLSDTGEWDLADPRQDVENLIAEQDAAKRLYEEIRDFDETSANVAGLVAKGYSQRETAKVLGYNPEGVSKIAANLWVRHRLKKAQIPTVAYYKKMALPIPITLRK